MAQTNFCAVKEFLCGANLFFSQEILPSVQLPFFIVFPGNCFLIRCPEPENIILRDVPLFHVIFAKINAMPAVFVDEYDYLIRCEPIATLDKEQHFKQKNQYYKSNLMNIGG